MNTPRGELAEGADVGEALLASRDPVDRHGGRRPLLPIFAQQGPGIDERGDGTCPRRAGGILDGGCGAAGTSSEQRGSEREHPRQLYGNKL